MFVCMFAYVCVHECVHVCVRVCVSPLSVSVCLCLPLPPSLLSLFCSRSIFVLFGGLYLTDAQARSCGHPYGSDGAYAWRVCGRLHGLRHRCVCHASKRNGELACSKPAQHLRLCLFAFNDLLIQQPNNPTTQHGVFFFSPPPPPSSSPCRVFSLAHV